MASAVPPGYNPETSLLQGGTAPILPVQGGGGSGQPPTNDYNASVSLLQGGTGTIEAVRGGGKAISFAPEIATERTFSREAAPKNVVRASRAYTMEIYDIQTSATTATLDTNIGARQKRLMAYIAKERNTPLLTSVQATSAVDGTFAYTQYPKYADCKPQLPPNFFDVMAKKVQLLDNKPHTIWLVPNLRGNKEVFESVYNKICPDGTLPEKDHVLVFLGSFYPDTPNETSVFLFDEIMKLKEKNPGQVFVVTPHDARLLKNGCKILENTYAMDSTLKKQEGKSKEIPTFFEPEILVFPHEQFLIRSVTTMPISKDGKASVGLLVRKGIYSKSYYIKGESTERRADPAPLVQFTTVLSDSRLPETKNWPPKSQQSIKCPKDMDCQHFELGFALEKLGETIQLNLNESKLYLFHITKEKIPYFAGIKEPGTAEEEEEEEEKEEEEVPPPIPEPVELEVEERKPPTGHYKADPAAVASEETVEIPIEGFRFEVRVVKSILGKKDPVAMDWLNGRFTQGEADLLNALQITPELLQKAFGVTGLYSLSNFLVSLTYSKCFTETKLLLDSECDDARRFLRKYSHALQQDCLTKAAQEMGKAPEGKVFVSSPPPSAPLPPSAPPGEEVRKPPAELVGAHAALQNLDVAAALQSTATAPRLPGNYYNEEMGVLVQAANGLRGLSVVAPSSSTDLQGITSGLRKVAIAIKQEVSYPSRAYSQGGAKLKSDVAGTYILWKGALLIHRRSPSGGHYLSAPGGQVDPTDIHFKTTALRELQEEAQISVNRNPIDPKSLKAFYHSHNSKYNNDFVFFAIELNDTDMVIVKGPQQKYMGEVEVLDNTIMAIPGFSAEPDKKYYRWVYLKELRKFLLANQNTPYVDKQNNFLTAINKLIKWLGI